MCKYHNNRGRSEVLVELTKCQFVPSEGSVVPDTSEGKV